MPVSDNLEIYPLAVPERPSELALIALDCYVLLGSEKVSAALCFPLSLPGRSVAPRSRRTWTNTFPPLMKTDTLDSLFPQTKCYLHPSRTRAALLSLECLTFFFPPTAVGRFIFPVFPRLGSLLFSLSLAFVLPLPPGGPTPVSQTDDDGQVESAQPRRIISTPRRCFSFQIINSVINIQKHN